MITCANITSVGDSYLKAHLSKNDYWQEGEKEVAGVWFGATCDRLGLAPGSLVTSEQFAALSDNRHPVSGEKLTARDKANRKSFVDIQMSAPKDVSVLAMVGGDERVAEAFRASVLVGLEALQSFAAVRERRGELATSNEARHTGNMVSAVYIHDSSRQLDPQLHAHCVTGNMTWDEATGRVLALQARDMMRASAFCRRAMYDDLAARLTALGYECYGMNGEGFQVRGVEHLRERYSKRTADIDVAAAEFEKKEGRAPTDAERAELTLQTRGRKLPEISTEEVRNKQRAELSPDERQNLAGIVQAAKGSEDRPSPALVADAATLDRYLTVGLAHANEHASVAGEWEITEAAIARAQSEGVRLDPTALTERLRARGAEDVNLHARPGFRVATPEVVAEERAVVGLALEGREAIAAPVGDVARLEAIQGQSKLDRGHEEKKRVAREWRADQRLPVDPKLAEEKVGVVLSDEQMAAARSLAASRDRVSILVGDAGTGKTASLNVLRDASAKSWIGLGPTTRARDELAANGFKDAATLQSFLASPKKQKAAKGSVVLVDESGSVGTPEMRQLLASAKANDYQVLLVGDPKQHASVIRGDALRCILAESSAAARPGEQHAVTVTRLQTVRRQEKEQDREISELFSAGKFDEAIERQEAAGYIEEDGNESAMIDKAAVYLVGRRQAVGKPGAVLGITPRWQDAERLTEAMRPLLRANGTLQGEDRQLKIIDPDGGFTAEAKKLRENYTPGVHALTWVRDCESIGAKRGQSYVVEGVEADGLRVRPMDTPAPRKGEKVKPPPPAQLVPWSDLRDAKVGRIKTVSLAAGDDILLRANCETGKKSSVANGTVRTVRGIGLDGRIQLVGGGVIPADFHGWTHGYSVTSHKAQGASVQEAVAVMGDAACASASRKQSLVTGTRHKAAVRLFVTSVDKIKAGLRRDDSRELATEMIARKPAERSPATGAGKPAAAVAAVSPEPAPAEVAPVVAAAPVPSPAPIQAAKPSREADASGTIAPSVQGFFASRPMASATATEKGTHQPKNESQSRTDEKTPVPASSLFASRSAAAAPDASTTNTPPNKPQDTQPNPMFATAQNPERQAELARLKAEETRIAKAEKIAVQAMRANTPITYGEILGTTVDQLSGKDNLTPEQQKFAACERRTELMAAKFLQDEALTRRGVGYPILEADFDQNWQKAQTQLAEDTAWMQTHIADRYFPAANGDKDFRPSEEVKWNRLPDVQLKTIDDPVAPQVGRTVGRYEAAFTHALPESLYSRTGITQDERDEMLASERAELFDYAEDAVPEILKWDQEGSGLTPEAYAEVERDREQYRKPARDQVEKERLNAARMTPEDAAVFAAVENDLASSEIAPPVDSQQAGEPPAPEDYTPADDAARFEGDQEAALAEMHAKKLVDAYLLPPDEDGEKHVPKI